jgi:hypothetical protein
MKVKPKKSLEKVAVQKTPTAKARRRDAATGENPKLAAVKEHRTKLTGSAVSTKDRRRSSQGSQNLQELFKNGAELFKGLDTKTIMRIAEDKDLEYL